jgi:hypothetical protein
MNQQPEKLFREKLENHSKPAPALAWNRIEQNLDKKNKSFFWLKIAASFLLVATASLLLWQPKEKETVVLQSAQQIKPKEETPVKVEKPAEVNASEITKPKTQEPPAEQVKRSLALPRKKQTIPVAQEQIKSPAIAAVEVETEPVVVEEVTEALTIPTETTVAETTSAGNSGVTLIYTAEEVNDKYLDKKSLAEATSEGKKSSTLRKLLDKAYDLKNNQDPFGDLRQKKNEILALNFKNEKQRSQNK